MATPIIEINKISKRYRLGHFGMSSFREESEKWMRRLRGQSEIATAESSARDFWALRDISFSVQPGEVVGIIGRNGAGKSTLLKILSRITEPTAGEAVLRGRVSSLLEVGTGFHPELSGRDNIYLNGAILGMKRAEITAKFDEIIAFAEIDQFIDTPVKRYSSGMYVKLAFAVAAHLEPEILIVDEVLAVGDIQFQKKCIGKMKDVAQRSGRTVLFVSHNTGAVASLTRKCAFLEKGALTLFADTPTVIQHYVSSNRQELPIWQANRITRHPLQITRLQLLDNQGQQSCDLELTEGFSIELDYTVRKSIRDTVVEVWLYSSDGTRVAILGDYDNAPERKEIRTPGNYRARLHIPGNLLNVDIYSIRINSCASNRHTFDHEDTVSFSISEHKGVTPRSGRGGLLSLSVPCEHESLGTTL
jgi:lipopolysaccharide transport system ATP-binding protein